MLRPTTCVLGAAPTASSQSSLASPLKFSMPRGKRCIAIAYFKIPSDSDHCLSCWEKKKKLCFAAAANQRKRQQTIKKLSQQEKLAGPRFPHPHCRLLVMASISDECQKAKVSSAAAASASASAAYNVCADCSTANGF